MNDKTSAEIGDGKITKARIMNDFRFYNRKKNQSEPKHSVHDDIQIAAFDFFVFQVSNQKERSGKNTKK
jgi:hypothetical protein